MEPTVKEPSSKSSVDLKEYIKIIDSMIDGMKMYKSNMRPTEIIEYASYGKEVCQTYLASCKCRDEIKETELFIATFDEKITTIQQKIKTSGYGNETLGFMVRNVEDIDQNIEKVILLEEKIRLSKNKINLLKNEENYCKSELERYEGIFKNLGKTVMAAREKEKQDNKPELITTTAQQSHRFSPPKGSKSRKPKSSLGCRELKYANSEAALSPTFIDSKSLFVRVTKCKSGLHIIIPVNSKSSSKPPSSICILQKAPKRSRKFNDGDLQSNSNNKRNRLTDFEDSIATRTTRSQVKW